MGFSWASLPIRHYWQIAPVLEALMKSDLYVLLIELLGSESLVHRFLEVELID